MLLLAGRDIVIDRVSLLADSRQILQILLRSIATVGQEADGSLSALLPEHPPHPIHLLFFVSTPRTPLASDARELLLVDHLAANNRGRRRFRYAQENRERPFAVEQAAAAALAVRARGRKKHGGRDESRAPAAHGGAQL